MDNWTGKKFKRAIGLIFIFYFAFMFYIDITYGMGGIVEFQVLMNASLTFGLGFLLFGDVAEHVKKNTTKWDDEESGSNGV